MHQALGAGEGGEVVCLCLEEASFGILVLSPSTCSPILGSPHGEHGLKLAVFWCVCVGGEVVLFFVFSEGSLQMR